MATQLNDMSLGGSGFAAGYTPIRFAPLVSLTGPIQGATPPTAAAPEAPMARPPMLPVNQIGGYEGMGVPFEGKPIGDVSRMGSPAGRQAELANLANAAGFFMNPLSTMANYVLTGKSPAQMFNVGDWRTAQGAPQEAQTQGIVPPGGIQGLLTGARNLLFGPQQQSVALGSSRADLSSQGQGMGFAAFNDAVNAAMSGGATAEMADAAGITALGLVAQGMDPASAVALASMTALGQVGPDMPAGMGGAMTAPTAQGATAQFAPQGLSSAVMAQMASGATDIYGKPITADAIAVNPIGGGGQIESGYDFGGYGGGTAGETGAPGESSYGLDR